MRLLGYCFFTGAGTLLTKSGNMTFSRASTGNYNFQIPAANVVVPPKDDSELFVFAGVENDDNMPFIGTLAGKNADGSIGVNIKTRITATTGNGTACDPANMWMSIWQLSKTDVINSGNP